jgi:MHS family proline/betaine transporter-like MFS transporter
LKAVAPVFGTLSDRFGRFKVLTIALLITGLSSYPMFVLLNHFPSVTNLLLVQAVVGVLIAASLGPIPAMLADIFPTSIRGTGLALSYNFSVTLFGGFAPLIVTWMIDATGSKLAPSFYVIGTALISVLAVICLGRRMRNAGHTSGDPAFH